MKNLTTLFLLFFLNSFIFATEFSVQGVLRDPLGRTVDDGNFVVTFKIYDVANGGTHLWSEIHPIVKVQHGIFTELLGSITSMEETLAFNKKYWIGITVGEDGQEMTPRTQLTTSPYSKAVLGDENVFPSVGNIGVGTPNPTAALHIISDEDNILHVTDSEGSKYIKINADGHMEISGDIQLTQNSAIRFYDSSSLTSSDLSGTASGLGNSESILIEAGEVIRLISGENEVEVTIDDGQLDVTGLEVKEDSKLKGALEVTGDSKLKGALDVAGDSNLEGNLTVQKTAYLDTLYVTKGGQIGTTLYVGDATVLNGSLAVAGATTLKATTVGGALNVTGGSTINGDHHGFGYRYQSVFFNIRNVPGKSKIFNVQGENEASIWYITADGIVHDTQGSSTVLPDRMVANDPPENSLNNIMNLNIVKYNNRGYKYGLVLDQVDDIYPELVKTTMPDKDSLGVVSGDSYKSVNMTGISAITIQAIKELKIEKDAEVKAIKKDYDAKLAAMLARINNLENQ